MNVAVRLWLRYPVLAVNDYNKDLQRSWMSYKISSMRGKVLPRDKIRGKYGLRVKFPQGEILLWGEISGENLNRGKTYSTTPVRYDSWNLPSPFHSYW